MEKIIICDVQMFTLNQGITVIDEFGNQEFVNSSMADLSKDIADLCLGKEIYNVHLIGNEKFIKGTIIPDIDEKTGNLYSQNKIKIEVN